MKKMFLEISQNSQESTCARASFLKEAWGLQLYLKETLAQVFSSEFHEISNTLFTEHLQWLFPKCH